MEKDGTGWWVGWGRMKLDGGLDEQEITLEISKGLEGVWWVLRAVVLETLRVNTTLVIFAHGLCFIKMLKRLCGGVKLNKGWMGLWLKRMDARVEGFVHTPVNPSMISSISFYHLSIHPFFHLSIHSSIHPSILSSIHPFFHLSSILPSIPPFSHLSIHSSIYLSILSSIHPFSIYPSILPSIHLFFHLSIHSSIYPSILPSIIHSSIYHPFFHLSSILPSIIHFSIYPFIHPFVLFHPPIYLYTTIQARII